MCFFDLLLVVVDFFCFIVFLRGVCCVWVCVCFVVLGLGDEFLVIGNLFYLGFVMGIWVLGFLYCCWFYGGFWVFFCWVVGLCLFGCFDGFGWIFGGFDGLWGFVGFLVWFCLCISGYFFHVPSGLSCLH